MKELFVYRRVSQILLHEGIEIRWEGRGGNSLVVWCGCWVSFLVVSPGSVLQYLCGLLKSSSFWVGTAWAWPPIHTLGNWEQRGLCEQFLVIQPADTPHRGTRIHSLFRLFGHPCHGCLPAHEVVLVVMRSQTHQGFRRQSGVGSDGFRECFLNLIDSNVSTYR